MAKVEEDLMGLCSGYEEFGPTARRGWIAKHNQGWEQPVNPGSAEKKLSQLVKLW